MQQLTHGSLFSGVGGFELGAQLAGINTIYNCEIVEYNRLILKKHFPHTIQYEDITTLQQPPYVDIISGGFPCQDISVANSHNKNKVNGKAKGINGERSGLWAEMFRIIRETMPQYAIIENSSMLTIRGLERVITDLSQIGYCLEWQCLQAKQFGYNHKRERLYGIAYPQQKRCSNNATVFRWLQKIHTKRPPRKNPLSFTVSRINGNTSDELLRMDDGFFAELDKRRIEAMGNAVVPEIANYLFECIKQHHALAL